jgi:hypothetical protein
MVNPIRFICSLAAGIGLITCRSSHPDATWQQANESAIYEAVLSDLLKVPADWNEGQSRPICLCPGDGVGDCTDPDTVLLGKLQARHVDVFGKSACTFDEQGRVRLKETKAVILGVGKPQWGVDDNFVRVLGWHYMGYVSGAQWIYRLSRRDGRWSVDSAKVESIS